MTLKYNATKIYYERVNLLGKDVLFTCVRVAKETVPEGVHLYEVRHADEGIEPCQLGRWIMVNFTGTILSAEPFELTPSKRIDNAYLEFDYEDDWKTEEGFCSLASYLKRGSIGDERKVAQYDEKKSA